jgi:hypothetical protein
MFLLRMWLQKLRIKFQVLKANMVALACRMVTRTTQGLLRGMQAPRFSALWWCASPRWEAAHG